MNFLTRLFMSKAKRAKADLEEILFPSRLYSAAYEKTEMVNCRGLHGEYRGKTEHTYMYQMEAVKNKYDKRLYDLFILDADFGREPVTIKDLSDMRVTLEQAKLYIDAFEKTRINEGCILAQTQPNAKKIVSTRFKLSR